MKTIRGLPLALVLLAAVAAAGMHIAVSLGNPVGLIEDDSVQVLLSRSLRHGAFALPDAGGVPISDPLPGLAMILMVPTWIVEPDWHPLRAVSLLALAVAVLFTWRLGRRLLPEPWPGVAAGLTAVSPVLLRHAGLVLPDIPFLALTLVALDLGTGKGSRSSVFLAAAAASLAALTRPHGAFLCAALAAGLAQGIPLARPLPAHPASGRGLAFSAPTASGKRAPLWRPALFLGSLIPLVLWLLRNKLSAGVSTGYAVNWRTQIALLGEPGNQLAHAAGLLSSFFGAGLAGIGRPFWLALAAGAAAAACAGVGATRLLRRREEQPLVFAMAAYAILLLCLHLTWAPEDSRYSIPLAPLVWLLVCSAAAPERTSEAALPRDSARSAAPSRSLPGLGGRILLSLLAVSALAQDARLVRAAGRRSRSYQPRTMAWLAKNTPPDRVIESLKYNTVNLLTGRKALPPPLHAQGPEEWAALSRAAGVAFLHVEDSFRPGGFIPQGAAGLGQVIGSWAGSAPGVTPAFRDPSEGASVFSLGAAKPGSGGPRTP